MGEFCHYFNRCLPSVLPKPGTELDPHGHGVVADTGPEQTVTNGCHTKELSRYYMVGHHEVPVLKTNWKLKEE